MRVWIASLFLGSCLCCPAEPTANFLTSKVRIRHATVGFYDHSGQTLAATLRFEKTYTDYQRKGFFRIGVLPIGVIEDVRLEVAQPACIVESLASLHKWLGPQAGNCIELRRITLVAPGPATNCLEAARARVLSGGRLELNGNVRLVSGMAEAQANRAVLQMTGGLAGQIIFHTTPPQIHQLFSGPQNPGPDSPEKPL
jgi:hypothetical protein